jgi:hypothetical protein
MAPVKARAAQPDGNTLLSRCTNVLAIADGQSTVHDAKEAFGDGYCLGFVYGMVQSISLQSKVSHPTTPLICLPFGGIKVNEGMRVIVKYLQENPANLHLDADVVGFMALKHAFPCKQGADGRG